MAVFQIRFAVRCLFPFHRHATRNILQVLQHADFISCSFLLLFLFFFFFPFSFFLSLASRMAINRFGLRWIFTFSFFFFSRNAFKKSHHAYYRTNRARSFFFVLIPIHPTAVRRTNEPWIFRRPANSIDNECLSIRLLVTYSISPRILRIRIPRETSAKDGIRVGSAVQAK